MKIKSVFLVLLATVLLLQSAWSVAAALCLHENTETMNSSHFGHHVINANHSSLHERVSSSEITQHNDHSDHLPSISSIVWSKAQQIEVATAQKYFTEPEKTHWQNLYQSPDLEFNSPPPILSPL